MHDAKTPYYGMKSLLMDVMGIEYDMTHQERENSILRIFQDPFILENLAILNNILHLKVREPLASFSKNLTTIGVEISSLKSYWQPSCFPSMLKIVSGL